MSTSAGFSPAIAKALRAGFRRRRDREVGHVRDRRVAERLADAQHVHGLFLQRLRARGGGEHDRAAAVDDETAVAHRERIGHHARVQHLLDRERLLLPRLRVHERPFARGDRDFGELLARRAVLMHVARRRHRVGADRQDRAVGRLVIVVFRAARPRRATPSAACCRRRSPPLRTGHARSRPARGRRAS